VLKWPRPGRKGDAVYGQQDPRRFLAQNRAFEAVGPAGRYTSELESSNQSRGSPGLLIRVPTRVAVVIAGPE
jgi:hypothetical protein